MESINQEDLFSDISIADFLFEKDSIFSELNLNTEELNLYKQVKKSLQIDPLIQIWLFIYKHPLMY